MYFACGPNMNFGRPEGRVYWVELCFHKRYVQVLTLGPCKFGYRVFADVIKLNRGRTGSGWALIQLVSFKRRKIRAETHRKDAM